jgi:hypothetical protein
MAKVMYYGGPVYKTTENSQPLEFRIHPTFEDFAGSLEQRQHISCATKDSNRLICPSLFGGFPNRKRISLECTSGLWLDNDTGVPHPKDFLADFPVKCVVYSSYNATPAQPKYRVYIPADALLIYDFSTLDGLVPPQNLYYTFLVDNICQHFPGGWDSSKRFPESLFYLPARNPQSDCNFFYISSHENHFPTVAFHDDYVQWKAEREAKSNPHAHSRATTNSIRKQMKIDNAVRAWQRIAPNDDLRHRGFFILALNLFNAGCDDVEIAVILEQQAHYSRNPARRYRQIKSTIENVKKYYLRN